MSKSLKNFITIRCIFARILPHRPPPLPEDLGLLVVFFQHCALAFWYQINFPLPFFPSIFKGVKLFDAPRVVVKRKGLGKKKGENRKG